jgi:hypothetical protein
MSAYGETALNDLDQELYDLAHSDTNRDWDHDPDYMDINSGADGTPGCKDAPNGDVLQPQSLTAMVPEVQDAPILEGEAEDALDMDDDNGRRNRITACGIWQWNSRVNHTSDAVLSCKKNLDMLPFHYPFPHAV